MFLSLIFHPSGINAGPFLTIDRVDTESDFPKIKTYLTIRNIDNTLISGLDEENLLVYEDGYRVNYVRVNNLSETEGLLYLVFSMDSSKSISRELLQQIKNSATTLLESSNDMIAIYRFNDKVEFMNNFTTNRALLSGNIKSIERHGKFTLLYNAIYDSIDLLNKTNAERKAVIVFTDGKDEGSSIHSDDVIKYAGETHIPVYFICLKKTPETLKMDRIARLTGGRQFLIKECEIHNAYRTILSMIKHQYVLEYQSMLEPDNKLHKMEIRLKYGSLMDRDQKEISIKKRLSFIQLPPVSEVILIALILILVIFIILALIYFFKKIRLNITSAVRTPVSQSYTPGDGMSETAVNTAKAEDTIPADRERIYTEAWLVERDGEVPGKKIPIPYGETTIGSEDGNMIVIKDGAVSPKHAKIKIVGNSFYLFDMASDKGTFLNESKLLRPKVLYDWDEIKIGTRTFIFRGSNIA